MRHNQLGLHESLVAPYYYYYYYYRYIVILIFFYLRLILCRPFLLSHLDLRLLPSFSPISDSYRPPRLCLGCCSALVQPCGLSLCSLASPASQVCADTDDDSEVMKVFRGSRKTKKTERMKRARIPSGLAVPAFIRYP